MSFARAAAVALVLAAQGCRGVLPPLPVASLDPSGDEARILLRGVETAAAERRSLRGLLRLALDGPDGSLRSTQVFVAERPSRLRVEVQGFLAQTVGVLVTDGERFDLFRTRERTLQRGQVYPGLLFDVARIDLAPDEAVGVLLGAPRAPEGLEPIAGRRLADGGAQLDLGDPTGAVLWVFEWGPDGLLRGVEARAPGGEVLWNARYEDYRPVDGTPFAHRVALRFPSTKTRVELELESLQLNPPLPPDIFVLQLPGVGVAAPPEGGG